MLSVVQHGETGGIPLHLLHQKLVKYKVEKDLPPGGLEALLKKADEDHDGVLDYEEFVRLVSGKVVLHMPVSVLNYSKICLLADLASR